MKEQIRKQLTTGEQCETPVAAYETIICKSPNVLGFRDQGLSTL